MSKPPPPIRPLPKRRSDRWAWSFFAVVFATLLTTKFLDQEVDAPLPWGWILAGLFAVGSAAWIAWTLRRAKRFSAENEAALAMLRAGELDAARERFAALVKRWPRPRNLNHVALFNLGWTDLLAGELEHARERWAQIEVELDLKTRAGFVTLLPCRLAYVDALLGNLDDARRWLASSRERGAEDAANRAVIEAWETAAEAVVACRAEEPGKARARFAERWRALEDAATGEVLRPLRVLRAFAIHAASNGADGAEVERVLAPVREHAGRELLHLAARWPAMRAFLAERGLG